MNKFVLSRPRVQCLSLCIDLYYVKQVVQCQDNCRNKASVISYSTLNDVMYFAISERGLAISWDIWHSYVISGADHQRRAALDRGTNLSFGL